MKFKIVTLGCKVNTYESEYMMEALKKAGFVYEENMPEIVIVNTCSVTNQADHKSLKIIRREKRENPEALMVVCGCSTQNDISKVKDLDIDIIIGNKDKSKIVELIQDYLTNHQAYSYIEKKRNLDFEDMQVEKFTTHTRAFIKIQDGCDNFCSYCIIPFTRGSIRSKDFEKTIAEAKTLVANKHQEIVLTGIHTGSYNNNNHDLSDLIQELANISNLKRIRLSSIEITELDAKFLEVLKNTSKLCNHLHIPLQSGSDKILKVMKRKYDVAYFKEKVKEIRKIRPDISLTTDVIVGHPYEEEKDFLDCLKTCEEIGFSKIHVFPYSLREGTAAANMPQVDNKIKKERARKLMELSDKLEEKYFQKFRGEEVEVLTEEYKNGYTCGFTSNYLKVNIEGKWELNKMYKCKVEEVKNKEVYAKLCLDKEKVNL